MSASSQSEPLEDWIRRQATSRGFCLAGICPAVQPPHYEHFCQWLDNGMAGSMAYLPERREAYSDPRNVLDGVQSVVMLGLSYYSQPRRSPQPGKANIARYAWGKADYHNWIHKQFKDWLKQLQQDFPHVSARGVVDTAPLLERDFARLAGLGWVGKNTMLINKHTGSYFFLAALLVDQVLPYDQPHVNDHCGTCTRCLDACPTKAFPSPGVLDSRKCISYLTIEQKSVIPLQFRSSIGNWMFGCDICQDVCPWNRHSKPTPAEEFFPLAEHNPVDLIPLFELNDEAFRDRFRKTPMWRSKRTGILRNAAIVLGNQQLQESVEPLARALKTETDTALLCSLIWSLAEIGSPSAISAIQEFSESRATDLQDIEIIKELKRALAGRPQ